MRQLTKLEDYLHLVEFNYKKNYHASLKMSSFEALYGCRCRTPITWSGPEDKLMLGLDMLKEMASVVKNVIMNLKAT